MTAYVLTVAQRYQSSESIVILDVQNITSYQILFYKKKFVNVFLESKEDEDIGIYASRMMYVNNLHT